MKELQRYILKNGLKVTPQRLAVLKILIGNRSHPTAEKIHHELLKEYPAISLKTVYDVLAKFVEAEMIRKLDIDQKKMRFDGCVDPHDHFHCRVCDNVFDVVYEERDRADNLRKNNYDGHRVDSVRINLKGVCKNCEGTVA